MVKRLVTWLTFLTFGELLSARSVPLTDAVWHEKRDIPVKDARPLRDDEILDVRIGLVQNANARENSHAWLMGVSHPASQQYGRHWTAAEVVEAFRPAQESVDLVTTWLIEAGGIRMERITLAANKAWLAISMSRSEAAHLFHADYYHHGPDGSMVGCDKYHVPEHLRDHIDFVTPGVKSVYRRISE